MSFIRSLLFVCPAACLLAQTPPRPAQPSAAPPLPAGLAQPGAKSALPDVPPDKVVITVGDQKITAAQFEQIIATVPAQYQDTVRGAGRKQFADNIVRILVLSDEGKRLKLDQTPAFKTQSSFQVANMLAGATMDSLAKDIKADPAEVQKFYDAHKSDYERVHARHILIRMQGAPTAPRPGQKELTEAEALAKAQELRKKIEGGADFADLARAESDDVTSGAAGGDLGFFGHNQMVPPFEEAAFAMKPGELSQPVKSPFGYHIIKVEGRENKSLDEMRPEIERRLRPEQAQKVLEEMVKKATVQFDPTFFPPATPAPQPPAAPGAAPAK